MLSDPDNAGSTIGVGKVPLPSTLAVYNHRTLFLASILSSHILICVSLSHPCWICLVASARVDSESSSTSIFKTILVIVGVGEILQ
jgi:hypothetical protein